MSVKYFACALFFILLNPFFNSHSMAKLAPWVILSKQIKVLLEGDQCVKVENLFYRGGTYNLDVKVCNDPEKALALATVLKKTRQMGNVQVDIRVLDERGVVVDSREMPVDVQQSMNFFETALKGNSYFVEIPKDPKGNPIPRLSGAFSMIFKKEVLQYAADNQAEFYANENKIVADVASEVFALKTLPIRVGVGTERNNK